MRQPSRIVHTIAVLIGLGLWMLLGRIGAQSSLALVYGLLGQMAAMFVVLQIIALLWFRAGPRQNHRRP
jgi:hypothetical protein